MRIPRTTAAVDVARVHLHGAVLDMLTFAFGFQLEPGNSQGKHGLRDLPVRCTGMELGQSERKRTLCYRSQGFRAGSSMGSGGPELSLHPASRHFLLRLKVFPLLSRAGFPDPMAHSHCTLAY